MSPDADGMDSEEERAFNGEREKGMSVPTGRARVVSISDGEELAAGSGLDLRPWRVLGILVETETARLATLALGRRATAGLAAIGALLLTVLTAAPQADAATIYACQNKGGTIHVVAKKATCKRDETKLWWGKGGPNAVNGVTGATGATGANGKAGASGATGEKGETGSIGVTGATGAEGKEGKAGVTGATGGEGKGGKAGVTGSTGGEGKEGKTGGTGSTGPEGKEGAVGVVVHWRKTIETAGPSESEPKFVVLATTGPFTLTGKCYESESFTEAATYVRTSEDGSFFTAKSENVPLNIKDDDTLIFERVKGTTATHEAVFGAPNNKWWAAQSHDGSVALTGFANQGVWSQGKTGPACSFSGYFVTE